jgi:CheY-like chemotaxis protein
LNIQITLGTHESGFDYRHLFDLAPHFLWAMVIVVVIAMLGPSRLANAFLSARKISFAGLEIDLKGDISQAVQAKGGDASNQLEGQVARRALRSLDLMQGARLLWIDENPANNETETKLFKRFGLAIDRATDDTEAERSLVGAAYDVVISNMNRNGNPEAGIAFLPKVLASVPSPPLIFYVGKTRPLPDGAFGLTTRPDELLNLVIDALERVRG